MKPRKFFHFVQIGGHWARLTLEWGPQRGTVLDHAREQRAEDAADECFSAACMKVRKIALEMNGRSR